jgi:hypothetical protein
VERGSAGRTGTGFSTGTIASTGRIERISEFTH